MLNRIKSLEKKIKGLEKEIQDHSEKLKKSNPSDAAIHRMRKEGAERELQKAKADLVLAVAERSRENKKIQSEIDKLQKEKNELSRKWVQSDDSDVKFKLDKQIRSMNKKIDKLEGKKK